MEPIPSPLGPPVRPPVVGWFKAYCALLSFLYLAVAVVGVAHAYLAPAGTERGAEAMFTGPLIAAGGLFFFVGTLPPLFVRPRPWVWAYGLVLICIGMTSPCFLPVCVPLLVYWLKPETKAWFGPA